MGKERNCSNCIHTNKAEDEFPCSVCIHKYIDKYEPITNYDRIKSMSVDELTSVILMLSERVKKYPNARITLVKQWLLQEVSENDV